MIHTNTPRPNNRFRPRPRQATLSAAILALAVLVAVPSPTWGQGAQDTRSWNGGFGSAWDTLGSWVGVSGPPDANDTANLGTTAIATSTVHVSGFRGFRRLTVDTPFGSPYILRGFVEGTTAGTLDASFQMTFNNSDREAAPANTFRLERIIMRTPEFQVANNAVVEFTTFSGGRSRLDTNLLNILEDGTVNATSSDLNVTAYNMATAAGRLNINSGGVLRMDDDGFTAAVTNGTANINASGSLILSNNHTLSLSGNSTKLNFAESWTMGDRGTLRVIEGAGVTAQNFVDVGNGVRGTLQVGSNPTLQSGATLTAGGSSDWGTGSAGNATVNILSGGNAVMDNLRMGTFDGIFRGSINGGILTATGTMTLGGGAVSRDAILTLTNGTLNANEDLLLENRADLRLNSGAANLLGQIRVRSGATLTWAGATVNFAADTTGVKALNIEGGIVNRTSAAAVALTDYATIRASAGGRFNSSVSTVNINNGRLESIGRVGTSGAPSAVSFTGNTTWGLSDGTTTVVANLGTISILAGNLTLSPTFGRTHVSIINGGSVECNTLTTGGSAQSSVYINVNNGRLLTRTGFNAVLGRGTSIEVGNGITGPSVGTFLPDALTLNRANVLVRSGGEIQTTGPLTANQGTVIEQTGGIFMVRGAATFNPGSFTGISGGTFTMQGGSIKAGAHLEVATGGTLTTSAAFTIDRFAQVLVSGGTFGPTAGGTIINNGLMTSPATASTWTGGTLEITNGGKYVGDSFLNFTNGGSLVVDGETSGMEINSAVTLSGVQAGPEFSATFRNGSTSLFSGGLRIGNQGIAFVALASNASLEAPTLNLGNGTGTGTGALVILGGSVTTGETIIHGNDSSLAFEGGTIKTRRVQSPPGKFNWTGGTLELTGGLTDLTNLGGPLVVPNGGTLKGTGRIEGDLAFGNGGAFDVGVLNSTAAKIIAEGTASIDTSAALNGIIDPGTSAGQKFFIVENRGPNPVIGHFRGSSQGTTLGNFEGIDFKISYSGDSDSQTITGGNDIVIYTEASRVESPYETWSGGALFGGDANNDGVPDGLAFLLGAPNPNAPAIALLPTVSRDTAGLVLTFDMLNAAERGGASLSIEHSSDLGVSDPWTTVTVPDESSGPIDGVTFSITGSDPLKVTATISSSEAAAGKIFGRLKAQIAGSQPF